MSDRGPLAADGRRLSAVLGHLALEDLALWNLALEQVGLLSCWRAAGAGGSWSLERRPQSSVSRVWEILVGNHSLLEFFAASVINFTSWQHRGWFHIRRLVRLHLWTLCFPHIGGPRGNNLTMCEVLWKTNFAQLCWLLASLYLRNGDNCNDYQWA